MKKSKQIKKLKVQNLELLRKSEEVKSKLLDINAKNVYKELDLLAREFYLAEKESNSKLLTVSNEKIIILLSELNHEKDRFRNEMHNDIFCSELRLEREREINKKLLNDRIKIEKIERSMKIGKAVINLAESVVNYANNS